MSQKCLNSWTFEYQMWLRRIAQVSLQHWLADQLISGRSHLAHGFQGYQARSKLLLRTMWSFFVLICLNYEWKENAYLQA